MMPIQGDGIMVQERVFSAGSTRSKRVSSVILPYLLPAHGTADRLAA
jgi:hypothetical protein